MANYLSDSGGKDFEIHPEGRFAARCIRVIGLGTQTSQYLGQETVAKKVMLAFETSELMTEGQYKGQPFIITARYTASIHEKSNLGKLLKKWRGRDFTDEERKKFDIDTLAGLNCYIEVEHNANGEGKTFANIDQIKKLPADVKPAKPFNKVMCFSPLDPDMDVFNALSKNIQATIEKSPEWKASQRGEQYAKDETASGSSQPIPDDDSDIPF